jgi:hypothetical protein
MTYPPPDPDDAATFDEIEAAGLDGTLRSLPPRLDTAAAIEAAIDAGHRVFWATLNYEVIKDSVPQYLIWSRFNDYYIGLTDIRGNLRAGEVGQFFTVSDDVLRDYPTHEEVQRVRRAHLGNR